MSEDLEDELPEEEEGSEGQGEGDDSKLENVIQVSGMYENWFLDYASYVILERAVPHVNDGLKPVQRRILHSMKEMDDGRYHKVANIIGNTMKYHPHGDASIGDALVQLGQKDLLIDCQGNWGNIYTGDSAAAPRYIEARLTKFALEVAFNAKTTTWQASYDGRGKEPVTLPMKFPLLLAQGVEGIAVGLACKILPHNFNEIIDASVKVLKGQKPKLVPDFPTGGLADFSNYNDGLRGGKIKVRARLTKDEKKNIIITEIPFGTTTNSLIDSILRANDKGKIKIKKIEDNTAEHVEIIVYLPSNVSPDKTIDALYAFTDCELSISPNACVIEDEKPCFMPVSEMLQHAANDAMNLLKLELEIKKGELEEQWHFASLEKIFIEKRIYRDIEECETWEAILETIHKGLKPHTKHLLREVTDEDVTKLTEIRIKRISKFDSFKADEQISKLEDDLEKIKHDLAHIVDFTIDYFKELKKKYGEGRERKTEIRTFESIDATKVAVSNVKLYMNAAEGFIGHGLKRTESEFVCDCSDIDNIIVFREDGKMLVTKIDRKTFVGKGIIYAGVWKKGDKRTIYNVLYRDGKGGPSRMKRFAVTGVTRDKEYDITKGKPQSQVLYFSANPNGEAEVLQVLLKPKPNIRKQKFEVDLSELAIKGRGAAGNIVTKYPVHKIQLKERGVSTLGARKIWYDDTVFRLNSEGRGELLGEFYPEDKILTIMQSGEHKLTGFDLATKFDDDMIVIEKWVPEKPVSAIYYDGEKKEYYVKRFLVEDTDRKVLFISEHEDSQLELVTTDFIPMIQVNFSKVKGKTRDSETINLSEFIAVKGMKARGNRLTTYKVKGIDLLEPVQKDMPLQEQPEKEEGNEQGTPEQSAETDVNDVKDSAPEDEETDQEEVAEKEVKKPAKKGGEAEKKAKSGDEDPNGEDQMSLF